MENEFVTVPEAAKLLKQDEFEVMRLIKDRAQSSGLGMDDVLKKQPTPKGTMYFVSKAFLLGQDLEKPQPTPSSPVQTLPLAQQLFAAKDHMIKTLEGIVTTKDRQIEDLSKKIDQLIERDRETNILLKGLQDRIFLLETRQEKGQEEKKNSSAEGKTGK